MSGSNTVVGMAYSDTQVLTAANNLFIDGTGIGLGKVVQGLTQLRTGDANMSGLNTTMNNLMGSTAGTLNRAVFSSTLPSNASLELTATASTFNLDTALSYGHTTASNAGLMTFTGIAGNGTTFTLSGGIFTSSKSQSYNGLVLLGANVTLTGTQITTSSTVDGSASRYNLTVTGPLTTGGSMSSLGTVSVTGLATLGGSQVTSSGTQTFGGNVVLSGAANSFLFNSALVSGANVGVTGTVTSTTAAKAWTVTAGTGDVSLASAVGGGAAGLSSVSVSATNLTILSIDATQAVTLNPITSGTVGLISGAATTLTKGAAGVLNLTAVNTFGGNTTITGGTLKLSGSGSLGAGTYAGDIALSAGTLLQDSSSADQTWSGVISGAGSVLKDTSNSVLTLAGANTLSGNVTVNVGTVVVTQNNGLGNNAGQATVASGAVLDIQNAADRKSVV